MIQMHAVIKRIMWILSNSACSRILVFSTWRDVLSILEYALTANKIHCLHPKGSSQLAKILEEFNSTYKPSGLEKAEKSTDTLSIPSNGMLNGARTGMQGNQYVGGEDKRVLLLLSEWSSEGLNLTSANHVLFVDPQLSPAVEAQAVGRIFR